MHHQFSTCTLVSMLLNVAALGAAIVEGAMQLSDKGKPDCPYPMRACTSTVLTPFPFLAFLLRFVYNRPRSSPPWLQANASQCALVQPAGYTRSTHRLLLFFALLASGTTAPPPPISLSLALSLSLCVCVCCVRSLCLVS
eukprot:4399469-Pleurochrysis_carterae.AAC.2